MTDSTVGTSREQSASEYRRGRSHSGEAEAGAGDCSGEAFSRTVGQGERESRSLSAPELEMGALHLEGLSGDDPELECGSSLELPARKRHRLLSSGSSSSSELDMGEVEEERSVDEMSLGESSPRTVEDGAHPGSPGSMDLGGCDSDCGLE